MARGMIFAISFFYAAGIACTPVVSQPASAGRAVESSLVIVRIDRFEFQPDATVSFSDDPDALFFGGVYRADAKVLKTLSGPPLQGRVAISLAGSHIDRWRNVKLLMLLRRDRTGGLWAGQQWARVTDMICLSDDSIEAWRVGPTFASAKRRGDGLNCIRA